MKNAVLRPLVLFGSLLLAASAQAQIYTCVAKDGSRVFSDQKCGTDAKPVPGITNSKRRPAASSAAKTPKPEPKSPEELKALMEQCNTGDVKACTTWTHGGGPNSLRERERKAEAGCEAGSLADCELRYCSDGASEECRSRVMQSAKVSGDSWYLRRDAQQQDDGSILYDIRCIRKDSMELHDATITCGIDMGPQRCRATKAQPAFARLDLAASGYCAATLSKPRT